MEEFGVRFSLDGVQQGKRFKSYDKAIAFYQRVIQIPGAKATRPELI